MSVDPTKIVVFDKSITLSNRGEIQDLYGNIGQLRFNQTTLKFEGYHGDAGADVDGNIWRPLTQNVSSTSNLGVFKVGSNLVMNPSTGVLSSIASGSGRIQQLVITVSPIVGAADYISINEAITNAIGTQSGGYIDGSITSALGSAPSPTYPFVIQLAPGQYSELLNQIILPDYVSLCGEYNYNSVITQYTGNASISTGAMLILGQNCDLHDLVINLADSASSSVSGAVYSLNKSNVNIDSCIFTCQSNISTSSNTSSIYMNGGFMNSIINCQFMINSSSLTGNFTGINILNTTPRIINNKIDILTPNASSAIGISLSNWDETESILDKTYIENMTISNNYKNTNASLANNIGILLNNSPLILKNSDIEVSNIPTLTNNYGIQFVSSTPLVDTTSSNIVSFVNTPAISNVINSSNASILNFVTLGFQHGQYISVSGSSNNDTLYKIKSITSATEILLDTGFQVITENANIANTITIKGLYNVDIQNSKINSSGIALQNNDNNSNYLFNLNNVITLGDKQITPSFTFNTNYKTFTVGKANCNFTSLTSAIDSITDNSSNTRYLIKIESGIYQEDSYITCKPYVNIEGNGTDNTTLLFYQSSNTNGIATANSSCLLLCSNTNLSGFTINNSSTGNEIGQRASTVLYNPSPITNLTLENIKIDSICNSYWNFGIYLVSAIDNIVFRNIYSNIYSNISANANTGIYNVLCSGVSYYNVTSTVTSPLSTYNYAITILNSECNIYNSTLISTSGIIQNIGIYIEDSTGTQKLVNIYNGQIKANNAFDYSIFSDNFYTVVCNNVQLIGDTRTGIVSSRIFCCGCYTFNDINDKTNIQSINSRGQNEQSLLTYNTLTIGDTAGKLDATGIDNVFIGVDSGSNVSTASNNTFIGSNTGKTTNIADRNTLIGAYVGQNITTGSRNTITGAYSGGSLTTGEWNTINGAMSALYLSSGNNNTIIGSNTAVILTSGSDNIFIGNGSGYTSNTASDNTMIGFNSGSLNETGNNNTYIGNSSGHDSVYGNNNVFIGNDSGFTTLSNGIVSVGNSAGYNNSNAIQNTYLGNESGYNNTTGNCNTYIGNSAGYNSPSASASFNTAVGNEAGHSLTTGSRNILLGGTSSSNGISNDAAGWSITSGNDNIHIGVNSGSDATSAIKNILIGSNVGAAITTACNNIIIGSNTAPLINTNGQNVIIGVGAANLYTAGNGLIIGHNSGIGYTGAEAFAIGFQAGSNISGNYNMFMGYNSGGLTKLDTSGEYNIAIGPYTGFNLSSGARNTIVGSGDSSGSAGNHISTGSDNTLYGYKSGGAIAAGSGNTLIGSNAAPNLTSGIDNLVLGYLGGFNLNSGSYNIILGPEAGYSLNNGQGNIYTGYQSGYLNVSGSYNINMGYQTGYTGTDNSYNIHLGHKSGYASTASKNLFLGYQCGLNNTIGTNNIFIGVDAGAGVNNNSEQIGDNNIFMGIKAGYSNDNGYRNIFMGSQAGMNSIDGSKNIFIGENAGSSGTTSHNIFIGTASSNTAGIGYQSNCASGIDGNYNVFIGTDVGIANTLGADNIFLGDKAGRDNTTGIQNIYIGTNAGKDANDINANYNIAIGTDAGIHNESGTENILIGRRVAGLLTSTNYNQNIIIGSEAGQNIQQNNQIFIGTNAGQENTTGDRNIFIGLNTGKHNIISNDNVVIGSDAGVSLIGDGSNIGDNVIIGSEAGHDLSTGTNNIYIGSGAGASAVSSINNVVIGANAMATGDANNVIIIGNNAGQSNSADANIFIGSNAGVQNTTGIGNIFVGYQAGYDVTTSNGNIIFGNETASSGRIADNNIILGNQTAKGVSNKAYFSNNIVMGADAGKTSNLSINSIMIGTNAVGAGTGGDVNIIMGNNTAIHLGDQNNYYATTLTAMTYNITHNVNNDSNYVTIDIAFGTGAYYFNYGDTIAIESLTNDYVFQSLISAILIDNDNIGNNGKTKLILNDAPIESIPIGSIVYVKNVKQNEIGPDDYSKSSSNMCIGDHSGFELTSGSKNAAIGDNAMYTNKVGRYNIAFGTEAGYSLNTDNNLCLGIKAGYSLDSYKDTSVVDDFIFYQSNNTIISTSHDFTIYPYGTQFDISGSSSNDARYNINDVTANSVIVQGYPRIVENGLPDTVYQSFFTIGSSQFSYTNYSYTGNISFDNSNVCIITYNSNIDAQNAYNKIKYISHFTINNSQYNDSIFTVKSSNGGGINLNNLNINIDIYNGDYFIENALDISIVINNISSINNINTNFFNCNIFSGDNFNIQFSSYNGTYKVSVDNIYQKQSILNVDTQFINNGIIVDNVLTNGIDYVNNIYIQGNTSKVLSINNVYIPELFYSIYVTPPNSTIFDAINNTITNIISPLNANIFVKISGTQYNNGYYYITSITSTIIDTYNIFIAYVDINFPLVSETVNNSINNYVIFKYYSFNNAISYNDMYKSNNEFKGNILRLKYTNGENTWPYYNYIFGTYILEQYYNNTIALNKNLLFPETGAYSAYHSVNLTLCDSNIKIITDDYISSNDLIFQTSNVSFNNITINNSNTTITTNITYEFVDIIAPVIIRIEGSLYNDGFYLVTENNNPFNVLTINGSFASTETSNITIKTNCISSFLGLIDLTYLQFNTEYKIFGSQYNDEKTFTLYNDPSCLSNTSVYLSDDTVIVNDTYNNVLMPLLKNTVNLHYSAYGSFNHFEYNNITVSFISSDTFQIDASSNLSLYTSLLTLVNNSYITLSNTTSNIYDGLYCIDTITYSFFHIITFVVNSKYKRNNIIYTSPAPVQFNPPTISQCDILSNQFLLHTEPFYTNNVNFTDMITGFGTNTKFLSFYNVNNKSQHTLTFEISSYELNISSISVCLTEICPTENIKYYIIQFGNPNPLTKISNIQRKCIRPIFYLNNINNHNEISLSIEGMGITFNSSTNTITISESQTGRTSDYINSFYYNSVMEYNDFRLFKPKQIIKISNTTSNNNSFLIDSISNDFKTLYLNTGFSSISSEFAYIIYINLQPILNNTPFDFSQFNLIDLSNKFKLLLFNKYNKNGYSYDGDYNDTIDNLSPVYFNTNNISQVSASSLVCSSVTNNQYFSSLCMNNTMLIPSSNLIYKNTNISFHNLTVNGSSDISFYSSNNTITSIATDLSSFITSEYILVSGTTNNNYLYRIDDSNINAPTSNTIIISQDYALVNEANTSATILANNINTSNITLTDLSVFNVGQVLIVSKTVNNNTNYTSNIGSNSPYSIYIDSVNVITEIPQYCIIEKSMLINETSIITGIADIDFNTDISGSHITITDNLTDFSLLRTGQQLAITGTSYNNTNITISDSVIPSNISITINQALVNETNTSAVLTKQIDFTIIGTPLEALTTAGYTKLYHYEDAEGNNAMIGSFAGQFVGSLNNAIYNVAIGSRCGQVNHGSGNIFIGNESKLATSSSQGATTYSNKMAIYKNNFIGVVSNPLIGGDFTSGKVGINTITPESFSTYTDITLTDTKLVVNGGAIANAFSPFTGCHIVNFVSSNVSISTTNNSTTNNSISNAINDLSNTIQVGMIVSSIGIIKKSSIINTYCSVKLSSVSNDKTVFGVYAFKEQSRETADNEYIIDSNGKYVKNLSYNNTMVNLYYVAALGEGCILITNINGEIQNGDYITTCPIAGYGALQSDDILHSYTVAKCTETIDWSAISNSSSILYNGIMYKTYLAGCTYHCG